MYFRGAIGKYRKPGGVPVAAPTPTPTPAPVFTVQPSISGTPQVGVPYVGTPGTASNTIGHTYRWLLATTSGGTYAAIVGATSTSYTPVSGDETKYLKFEDTATGPGGSTVATTTFAGPVAAAASINDPVTSNLSSGWTTGDNPPNWDTTYSGTYYDPSDFTGDGLRIRYNFNGAGFVTLGWIPFDINYLTDGFTYPFLTDGTLNAGGTIVIQVQAGRDFTAAIPGAGTPAITSAWSNAWSDTLNPASYAFGKMVMEGDSITDGGYYYSDDWRALRGWTRTTDADPLTITAVSGSGMNDVEARTSSVIALNPSLVTLLIGANDLFSQTASAYYSRIITYFNTVKASKPGCKFALAEILPIDPNAAANSPPAKNTHNAKRAAVSTLMRAGVGTDFDIIIPFGSAPIFTDAAGANTSLFADGLHPDGTAARAALVAIYEASVAQAIASNLSTTTPNDFTVTNATGQTVSTDTIITFGPITGLGVGKTATFSKTSGTGTIARGNQDVGTAFGTSSLTLVNGDYGRVKITSSASAGTPVSITFSVGGISKTATVTTAAASSPVGYATIPGQQGDGAFSATWTGSNITVPTGGGRFYFIVYSFASSRQPTSFKFTKSGVDTAATMYDSTTEVSFWYADLAAGVYTPSMATTTSLFAWVGFQGILATNFGSQNNEQKIAANTINNPVAFASSQPVPTNSLGFEWFITSSTISTRNDGSTQRDTLTIADPYNGTRYVSVGTLPATATPSVDLSGSNTVNGAFAVTAAP